MNECISVSKQKSEHQHWILQIQIILGTKIQLNWQFKSFGPNLPRKVIFALKHH